MATIPAEMPTTDTLLAEAHALGSRFARVKPHPADVLADAEALMLRRSDVSELGRRGYPVTDAMFTRVELLSGLLTSLIAQRSRSVSDRSAKVAAGERARIRLLAIRQIFSRIGTAAGLDSKLFALNTSATSRLPVVLLRLTVINEAVKAHLRHMPDTARVTALVDEADALIEENRSLSMSAKLSRSEHVHLRNQVCRLLFDTVRHLSRQGLAAFDADARAYRLDHTSRRRTKTTTAQPPGVGPRSVSPPAPDADSRPATPTEVGAASGGDPPAMIEAPQPSLRNELDPPVLGAPLLGGVRGNRHELSDAPR